MGDISIIARRLADGHVQYGWSGNGGYYSAVGSLLNRFYKEPETVEYLFGLGQLRHLGIPYNEVEHKYPQYLTNIPANSPHYLGTTEDEIFSKILFVDYGYFYDTDNRWYYISPGAKFLKIPLHIVACNLDNRGNEFTLMHLVRRELLAYIFGEYAGINTEFAKFVRSKGKDKEEIYAGIPGEKETEYNPSVIYNYAREYEDLLEWFDRWVVADVDPESSTLKFKIRPAAEKHVETIYW